VVESSVHAAVSLLSLGRGPTPWSFQVPKRMDLTARILFVVSSQSLSFYRFTDLMWNKIELPASAPVPPPRWRHTATAISKTQLLVFGGFHTGSVRLNDVWVFDLNTKTWVSPVVPMAATGEAAALYSSAAKKKKAAGGAGGGNGGNGSGSGAGGAGGGAGLGMGMLGGAEGGATLSAFGAAILNGGAGADSNIASNWDEPIIADANPLAPSPRGAHSAVVIGEYLWVFGGYGGTGFQRRDFNDLHKLHIPTMQWQPVLGEGQTISGTPPGPRSGHAAMQCENSLIIMGGWSANGQYNDVHIFDTEKLSWTQVPEASFGPFRWNHANLAIQAVPHWQCFVFGGSGAATPDMGDDPTNRNANKDKGSYLGDLHVLDTGSMRWTDLTPQAVSKGRGMFPKNRADATMVYDGESI
jgi:N-acetylneuraminic acid mutarotase